MKKKQVPYCKASMDLVFFVFRIKQKLSSDEVSYDEDSDDSLEYFWEEVENLSLE